MEFLLGEGSFRAVYLYGNGKYVIKRERDTSELSEEDAEESYEGCCSSNRNELTLYKHFMNKQHMLCPIDLVHSDEESIVMERAVPVSEYIDIKHTYNKNNRVWDIKVIIKDTKKSKEYSGNNCHSDYIYAVKELIDCGLVETDSVEKMESFLDAAYKELGFSLRDDLHLGNLGVLDGKLVVIDYGMY